MGDDTIAIRLGKHSMAHRPHPFADLDGWAEKAACGRWLGSTPEVVRVELVDTARLCPQCWPGRASR